MQLSSLPTLLRKAPGYAVKRARRWLVAHRTAWRFRRAPDHRAVNPEDALNAVRSADGVLFLCWGNICRSPMAGRYLRSRLADRGVDGVTVRSAGLGKYEDRESPPDAVEAASRYDVDLADHRSVRTTEDLVETGDVVFVMDYNNYHTLTTRYPDAEDRTFFLGPLADDRDGTDPAIPDPHGRGPERFERAYATIVEATDRIADAMEERHAATGDGGRREREG